MNIRRILGTLLCAALLTALCAVPSFALDSGVYTAKVVTSYYNPDTGKVDDGGTANAALGEGMCRSATAETGLVEVDKDGNIWLTIRLLLQSNCRDVAFYTRSSYDSYSGVSYIITAEDAVNDSIDYRFKVSDAGVKLKGTMYVEPMGRDVLWYLYVDTATLKAGSGDFEVGIDLSAAAVAGNAAGKISDDEGSVSATANGETAANTENTASGETAAGTENTANGEAPANSENDSNSEEQQTGGSSEAAEPVSGSADSESETKSSGRITPATIAAVIAAAAVVIALIVTRIKRNK